MDHARVAGILHWNVLSLITDRTRIHGRHPFELDFISEFVAPKAKHLGGGLRVNGENQARVVDQVCPDAEFDSCFRHKFRGLISTTLSFPCTMSNC